MITEVDWGGRAVLGCVARSHTAAPPFTYFSMAAPPDPGTLDHAQSWYYTDDAGGEQGPFPAANMRSWLLHGMIPHTTKVAPSFYGEIPEDFWPISTIWEDPTTAWASADVQLQQQQQPPPQQQPPKEQPADRDAIWKAKVAQLAGQHEAESSAGPATRDGKAPRPGPYDRPGGKGKGDGGGKGKGGDSGKGKGGGKGGGKGKGGGRSDPNRALPPHLSRIRAMAQASAAYSDSKFTPAGAAKSSYSYNS